MCEELSHRLIPLSEECLQWMKTCQYSHRTIDTYRLIFENFQSWLTEQPDMTELTDLTLQNLEKYIVEISLKRSSRDRKKTLSSSTINSHIYGLKKLFSRLKSRGLIFQNPTHEMDYSKRLRGLPRNILSPEQMLRILAQFHEQDHVGLRNRAAIELLYSLSLIHI